MPAYDSGRVGALELEALAGAAQNLGAQRIASVLTRETEVVRGLAEGQKVAVSASLKRETGMMQLAMLILKRENEENVAARVAGKVATRQAGKETRWKTALIAKLGRKKLPASGHEPAAAADAPSERGRPRAGRFRDSPVPSST